MVWFFLFVITVGFVILASPLGRPKPSGNSGPVILPSQSAGLTLLMLAWMILHLSLIHFAITAPNSGYPGWIPGVVALCFAVFSLGFFILYICKSLLDAMRPDAKLHVLQFVATIGLSATGIILSCAGIYQLDGIDDGNGAKTDAAQHVLYFSTVAFSTLGFGDMKPVTGLSQTVAALEAILGNMHLGALIGAVFAAIQGSYEEQTEEAPHGPPEPAKQDAKSVTTDAQKSQSGPKDHEDGQPAEESRERSRDPKKPRFGDGDEGV